MAGDLPVRERAILNTAARAAQPESEWPGRTLHRYGRLSIVAVPEEAEGVSTRAMEAAENARDLSLVENIGLAAYRLRESAQYREAKRNRSRAGEMWNMQGGCTRVGPAPRSTRALAARAPATPTSSYLEGTVAVGIVIVEGPAANLQFTNAERTTVVAEVQNGLSFFPTANPVAGISFSYDIQVVRLNVPADPNAPDLEALWRDPAMAAIGFSANWDGVWDYIEDIRNRFGTRWTYCGFFTKYPLGWFAYASIGGPRIVMDYANDGWGPGNIDRVFAHETGHIFGCPDEYSASNCDCGGSWGRFGIANGNCERCASGGGVACLMKGNTLELCGYTPSHLGWAPPLLLRNFGYNAGGWRVDMHPRFVTDITGDGRADIVGFGNAGVWVSRATDTGGFETPLLSVENFGYTAGSWRVEMHPRILADVTGDGRPDIVGFGNDGVWVSLNNGDGTFQPSQLVVNNFGYNAGGWRVEMHPRFMADVNADGRADIVGFGNAGVWVALSNGDGTFQAPALGIENFGYNAGGWRVEMHPRFMADVNADGRADIVGFGNSGVWVALSNGDGTFQAPVLGIENFGYNAGSWRVDMHPRLVADLNGDGRADILGFGNAGVWVSLGNGDGTFQAPQLAVGNFGYHAGNWRVDMHPRMLADTTGDSRLDIVGFGDEGVWVARSLGNGTFEAPGMVIRNFGYNAGGWRVDMHPRFVVDTSGNGRADIVGFGNAGVYVARF